MSKWTHPICEADWIKKHSEFDDEGYLKSIRRPVRVAGDANDDVEQCCFCGNPTIFGIFVREDPATLPHCNQAHDD